MSCLVPGGQADDGLVSLSYDLRSGELSLVTDGSVMSRLHLTSQSAQFTYPNDNQGLEIASDAEILKTTPPFTDLTGFAALLKDLTEFEVISDLRIDASVVDPGRDGIVGTNDDFVRELESVDLIYPIARDEIDSDSPNDAIELSPEVPFVTGRTLDSPDDEDWYKFVAPTRGQLSVEAFFEHQTGDAELDLYDEQLELVARSSTLNRNESVKREVLAGEQFFIKVYGFEGATQSHYDLVASLNPEELPVYVLRPGGRGPAEIDVLHPTTLNPIRSPITLPAFGLPTDIELGPNGLIYVAFDGMAGQGDSVVELTPQGVVTHRTHLPAEGVAGLPYPNGIEVLEDGTILVAQPNLNRIAQVTRQGFVEQSFLTGGLVPSDTTVVTGPQAVGAGDIQRPVASALPDQASVSPNPFGQYWIADTNHNLLRLFDSTGAEIDDYRIDANNVRDVQESANRDVYSLEGQSLRVRTIDRRPETGFFANFSDITTTEFDFAGTGTRDPRIIVEDGNSFARITGLSKSNHHSIAFDEQFDQTGPEPNGFVLSFDFRMSNDTMNNAAGGCCGSAADGFGIGLFAVDTYGDHGPSHPPDKSGGEWERPAFSDAFTVGFDVFPNVDRVTLNWDGIEISEAKLDRSFDLNDNAFHQAVVHVTPDGSGSKATVWIDETLVLHQVAISTMQLDKLFNYRVIAGGRTGDAYSATDIDNIAVNSVGFYEDFQGTSENTFEFENTSGSEASIATERSNDFARLTNLDAENNNSLAFDEVPFQTGASRDGLLLSFDFRMTDDQANDDAGGCCESAGEGLGIGLFNIDKYDRSGALNPAEGDEDQTWDRPFFESAFSIGLRVSGNRDEISVNLGSNQVFREDVTGSVDFNDNQFHHASVKLTPRGESTELSLWIDDVQIFRNQTLDGLRLSQFPNYRVIAGGRTSDSFTESDIDNISIASIGMKSLVRVTSTRQRNVGPAVAIAVTDGEFPVVVPGQLTDRDGDGLFDKWETDGVDINLDGIVDLVLPGADPDHKDIYVEIDALAGFEPSPAALAKVRAAFAEVPNSLLYNPDGKPGIRLHTIVDESIAPTRDLLRLPSDIDELWEKFYREIRTNYFGSPSERTDANAEHVLAAKDAVYRYTFWGNERGTLGRSGIAEMPGRNLMITMGAWRTPGGTPNQQAAIFMHELGHTLGLGHGSGDHIPYKPNHLSVMNYSHSGANTLVNGETFLDYSRYAPNSPDPDYRNINLDEAQLAEDQGFGFPLDVNFVFALGDDELEEVDNSVDWNRNGILGEVVQRDLTKDRPGELLKSHNEWGRLIFESRNYHESGDGDFPDDEPTTDICDRYNADSSASGVDQFECNDEESVAWPREPDQELPVDDEAAINGPADEDWFTIENLDLDDLITILIEPLLPTDPAPSIEVVAYQAGNPDPLAGYSRTIGSSVEHTFVAQAAGDYFSQLTLADTSLPFASYRLTIGTSVPSTTFTWNGSVSSEWSNASNWEGGQVPTPGQNIVIPVASLRSTIHIDSDQLINTLTLDRDIEFTADPGTTIGWVEGDIDVTSGMSAVFGENIALIDSVHQTGDGEVELYGTAQEWTVNGSGMLIGFGAVENLTVMPSATVTAGDLSAPFSVGSSLDLQGKLLVDVMAYQVQQPDLDTIVVAGNVTIAESSQLLFAVAIEPTPHMLDAVGLETDSVLSGTTVAGTFGTVPTDGAHLDFGIFFQSASNDGTTYDVTILHAVAGDSDGINGFGSGDLVTVFTASEYEDGIPNNSSWVTGDWNHDGDFDTSDLVLAFTIGVYEQGPVLATAELALNHTMLVGDLKDHRRARLVKSIIEKRRLIADANDVRQRMIELAPNLVDSIFR